MIPADSKKTELLKLPHADWGTHVGVWYDYLLIVPSRSRHDSGWSHMAVVGCNGETAELIIAFGDDLGMPVVTDIPASMGAYEFIRMDCYWPSGVLRMHSSGYEFCVDYPVSSVAIKVRRKARAVPE